MERMNAISATMFCQITSGIAYIVASTCAIGVAAARSDSLTILVNMLGSHK
jgi:hypothetical protein